ncbi:hypothetical protein CL622_00670 [archaeon]|nr:hypothetical protein [archaeon]
MLKLFGVIDILAALATVGTLFGITSPYVLILVAILLLKSVPFIPDVASIIDVICTFILVLGILGFSSFFGWIAVVWFTQKGLFSFISL